ncbi:MFS transporter [Lichenifustis flavocetrariae]|uniref:MFS transporter n=1 Tax=Lichenifustis flavocetrariae TaxID=2949735 RepID=A0AA41Z147_9HYPH|nr:MFS transporter [Lichenifustis flavocetrariae]MCW6511051.1 MFS transporter [Lichenifustis flavocetrariae]
MDDQFAQRSPGSKAATVVRVASGNFLEMFDFFLYGFYAKNIAAAFFPAEDEFASLMSTLVVFGAGFLMRPLGALVLGSYIDRIGRRRGLILTLGIMASGTVLIAFVPPYASIGVWAPLLVLLGRLLQGFSAGVELGGVSVYLSEMATPGHKGFYVAWQSASQQVATVVAATIGYVLAQTLQPEAMGAWGWRIPFVIGCLIVPFLFAIRRSLQETESFAQRTHHPTHAEIMRTLADNWRIVLAGMALVLMTTVSFYLITAYTPTFGERELKLTRSDALIVTCCVGISNLIWLPIWGAISDRIGRKPILIAITILTILTAYPALSWLARAPSFIRMLEVELWLSFLYSSYNGAMVVALTEIVPASVRASGFSLAYSLATTLGGFSLAISTWLIEATGDKAAPGLWMTAAAVCGLGAAWVIYRPGGLAASSQAAAVPPFDAARSASQFRTRG